MKGHSLGALLLARGGRFSARAEPTPAPRPTVTGVSAARLQAVDAHYRREVERGTRSGYVLLIAHGGRVVHQAAYGVQDLGTGAPMTPATRFRMASMTKLVTSVAVMTLIEDGKLQLSDPVSRHLPEFAGAAVQASETTESAKRPITVRDLLTHTSGLGYRFDAATPLGRRYIAFDAYGRREPLAGVIRAMAGLPLYSHPGARWQYSYATDVLGRLVEVASEQTFDSYLQSRIFAPLRMRGTGFRLAAADRARLATVYSTGSDGRLVAMPGDVFGDPFSPDRWPSGGAGLVSTGPDYMRFLLMLESGGALEGARILSPASVALMTRNHLPDSILERLRGTPLAGMGFGLGPAVVMDAGQTGSVAADGDYLWSGHFDTHYFVSPSTRLVAVVLSQHQDIPAGPPSRTFGDLRALAYGALR